MHVVDHRHVTPDTAYWELHAVLKIARPQPQRGHKGGGA